MVIYFFVIAQSRKFGVMIVKNRGGERLNVSVFSGFKRLARCDVPVYGNKVVVLHQLVNLKRQPLALILR